MTFLFILCRNILPVLILFWLFNKRILTFYGEKTVSFLCLESDIALSNIFISSAHSSFSEIGISADTEAVASNDIPARAAL